MALTIASLNVRGLRDNTKRRTKNLLGQLIFIFCWERERGTGLSSTQLLIILETET